MEFLYCLLSRRLRHNSQFSAWYLSRLVRDIVTDYCLHSQGEPSRARYNTIFICAFSAFVLPSYEYIISVIIWSFVTLYILYILRILHLHISFHTSVCVFFSPQRACLRTIINASLPRDRASDSTGTRHLARSLALEFLPEIGDERGKVRRSRCQDADVM